MKNKLSLLHVTVILSLATASLAAQNDSKINAAPTPASQPLKTSMADISKWPKVGKFGCRRCQRKPPGALTLDNVATFDIGAPEKTSGKAFGTVTAARLGNETTLQVHASDVAD